QASWYSFFFQAEDGIRDPLVTGVSDVCSSDLVGREAGGEEGAGRGLDVDHVRHRPGLDGEHGLGLDVHLAAVERADLAQDSRPEIGRASGREGRERRAWGGTREDRRGKVDIRT